MTEATVERETVSQDDSIRNVLGARFRANAEFELTAFERLPREQQQQWKDLANDPSFFGVLLPRPGTPWRAKSACRDTALLFFSLQSPGQLPAFAIGPDREAANRAVAQLVLDGILCIEADSGFVSGPAASARILHTATRQAPACPLASLSADAVSYGASLLSLDAARLSARLYFYNRLPLTAHWRERFPDGDAVKRELGGDAALKQWAELPPDPTNDGWISYRLPIPSSLPRGVRTYKLYFSPRPEHLREAFPAFLAALAGSGCVNFKTGRNAAGLLRPDKIVAYFHSRKQVEEAAQRILTALKGCPAQGVPFTAPVGDSLLVSWGVDPPAEVWERRESWRLWVTNRLAVHLHAAHAAQSGDAVSFALNRIHLEYVDTATWTPQAAIWAD